MNVEYLRHRLIHLAQGIVGNYSDAEDIVAEAIFSLSAAGEIHSPKAWLTKVVINAAIDHVRSARVRREIYIGPELPETAVVATEFEDCIVFAEEVDLVIIRLLQDVDPVDRTILVLHDVAGYTHPEIAEILNITAAASRQRLRRVRQDLQSESTQTVSTARSEPVVRLIHESLNKGDVNTLISRLSEGAVLWTDANGAARAARNPIIGRDKVTRFIVGIIRRYGMPTFSVIRIHGAWALKAQSADMLRVISLEVNEGKVTGIQVQQVPEKIVDP